VAGSQEKAGDRGDIVSKMAEALAYQGANAFITVERRKNKFTEDETDTFYEELRKWYVDTAIIGSKLDSYFSEEGLSKRWIDHCHSLRTHYV
jgi:hypothetical protein